MSEQSYKPAVITSIATVIAAVISVLGAIYIHQRASNSRNDEPNNTTKTSMRQSSRGAVLSSPESVLSIPKSTIKFTVSLEHTKQSQAGGMQATIIINNVAYGPIFTNLHPRSIDISIDKAGPIDYKIRGSLYKGDTKVFDLQGGGTIVVESGDKFQIYSTATYPPSLYLAK